MDNKILVIDRIEDIHDDEGELAGKQVFDKAGNSVKVKKGQGGKLKDRWGQLEVGRTYSFTMGLFQDKYPYVQDFTLVKDAFVIEAAKKVGDQQDKSKNRSVCLSYAKDLAVADKIPVDKILSHAEDFVQWVEGNTKPIIKTAGDVIKVLKEKAIYTKEIPLASKEQLAQLEKIRKQYGYSPEDVVAIVKEKNWAGRKMSELTSTHIEELMGIIIERLGELEPEDVPF